MKISTIRNGLMIASLALIVGIIGIVIAILIFLNNDYEIPWNQYPLKNSSEDFVSIIYVEVNSFAEDPTGDTIYVSTKDGLIFSNTLFEEECLLVESVPAWETKRTSDCAPVWPGAQSDAQIWDPPPTEKNILDSAGIRFERPVSIIVRCYVLADDGSLEVWVREGDFLERFGAFVFYAPCLGIIGLLVGTIIGVYMVRKKNKKVSEANFSQPKSLWFTHRGHDFRVASAQPIGASSHPPTL